MKSTRFPEGLWRVFWSVLGAKMELKSCKKEATNMTQSKNSDFMKNATPPMRNVCFPGLEVP